MVWYPDGNYNNRTNPVFEMASAQYDWLNYTLAIGVGKFIEGGVTWQVYAIK